MGREILFLEHEGGVLGLRVDVEEPLHLVNPRFAQDLRIGFAMRTPIVSMRFRPPSVKDVEAETRMAHVLGPHGARLSRQRGRTVCRRRPRLPMNQCPMARHRDPSSSHVLMPPPIDALRHFRLLKKREWPSAPISSWPLYTTFSSTSTVAALTQPKTEAIPHSAWEVDKSLNPKPCARTRSCDNTRVAASEAAQVSVA